jgi:uncharacterized membrane protein YbhN (UPF0104 family)
MDRRIVRILQTVLAAAILFIALRALRGVLANYRWQDFLRYVAALPPWQVALATLLTAAGYLSMTAYDTYAFRYIGRELPYRRIAFASFTAYAVNNNLGLSGAVGMSWRYRLYRQWGIAPAQIATVFVFCTTTYWLGFILLGGGLFLLRPPPVPAAAHLPFASVRLLGALLLIPAIVYLAYVVRRRSYLPLLAISIADWMVAGSVLYVLRPSTLHLSWTYILGVFLLAQIGGLISNVPGGLGVFEAITVMLLAPYAPAGTIVGMLIAFRGIYLLLPLFAALLLLAGHLLVRRKQKLHTKPNENPPDGHEAPYGRLV